MQIFSSHNVGRNIATDGITVTGRTVRVEFTSVIARLEIDLREITISHKLDIEIFERV